MNSLEFMNRLYLRYKIVLTDVVSLKSTSLDWRTGGHCLIYDDLHDVRNCKLDLITQNYKTQVDEKYTT